MRRTYKALFGSNTRHCATVGLCKRCIMFLHFRWELHPHGRHRNCAEAFGPAGQTCRGGERYSAARSSQCPEEPGHPRSVLGVFSAHCLYLSSPNEVSVNASFYSPSLLPLYLSVVNKSKMLSAGVSDVVLKFLQSEMPPVQFKLLGTLRMLIDTQGSYITL